MNRIVRLPIYAFTIAAIDVATWFTLTRNLRDGIYPTAADTIAIPFAEVAIATAVGGLLVLVTLLLCMPEWPFRKAASSRIRALALGCAFFLSYFAALTFFLVWGWGWWTPHHYAIAVSCWLVAALIGFFGGTDLARLLSDNPFKLKASGSARAPVRTAASGR